MPLGMADRPLAGPQLGAALPELKKYMETKYTRA